MAGRNWREIIPWLAAGVAAVVSVIVLVATLDIRDDEPDTTASGSDSRPAPKVVVQQGPRDVIELESGRRRTCALRTDKTVTCWGTPGEYLTSNEKFTTIVGGGAKCGLRADQTVACWDDSFPTPPAEKFTAIAIGGEWGCGLRADKTTTCWSFPSAAPRLPPEPPGEKFTTITASADFACGLRADKTAKCWGERINGPPPAKEFAYVDLGIGDGGCGLRPDHTVTCWGTNDALIGRANEKGPPQGRFNVLTTESTYACVLRKDRFATCWGSSVLPQPPRYEFTTITVDFLRGCGLRPDRTVVCWTHSDEEQAPPPSK